MDCTKQYNYQYITNDPIKNIFTVYTRRNQQENTLAYKATDVHKYSYRYVPGLQHC